ncbi:MAG: TIGR04086 family membrane protein [Paenibacillaceae bacterium]
MEPTKNTASVHFVSPLFSGIVYAFITMAIFSLLYSFVLTFTNQNEDSLTFFVYLIHAIAISIGSYVCGKRTNHRGWYHGGMLGLIYAAIIILIGFLSFDHGLTFHTLLAMIAAYLIGALGGILGVNHTK